MPIREYDEMPFTEAKARSVQHLQDGYGDTLIFRDERGYWALYYFYWSQTPPAQARPHWMEGPQPTPAFRTPYEMKIWLEENGYESFSNDLD